MNHYIYIYIYNYWLCVAAQAVLRYKTDGKVLDMQSVTVPAKYKSQGLALLAEV